MTFHCLVTYLVRYDVHIQESGQSFWCKYHASYRYKKLLGLETNRCCISARCRPKATWGARSGKKLACGCREPCPKPRCRIPYLTVRYMSHLNHLLLHATSRDANGAQLARRRTLNIISLKAASFTSEVLEKGRDLPFNKLRFLLMSCNLLHYH